MEEITGSFNASNDDYIRVISCYIENLSSNANDIWPLEDFQKRSYQIWIAGELLDRILDKPFCDPEITTIDFLIELDVLKNAAVSNNANRIFVTAIQTVYSIMRHCERNCLYEKYF